MKRIILTIILLTWSFLSTSNDHLTYCTDLHGLAAKVMELRQERASMAELFGFANGSEIIMEIIKVAYETQVYNSESFKQAAIDKFANDIFIICIEAR